MVDVPDLALCLVQGDVGQGWGMGVRTSRSYFIEEEILEGNILKNILGVILVSVELLFS